MFERRVFLLVLWYDRIMLIPKNIFIKFRWIMIAVILVAAAIGGFFIYKKFFRPSYSYVLAEFAQKQQTFSPYTKYEPSFAIDKTRGKIYYVFKAMDDNDIWQIWSASSDLDGNNWQEVKQTDSSGNKQRPAIIYNPKDDLIYYFYRTGNELGASAGITRRLIMAVKKPGEEKWRQEKELVGNNGIDDTTSIALDSSRRLIVFTYTKNNQIATAFLNLENDRFQEIVHTKTAEMNFIPNLAYDEDNGTAYVVFPRARAVNNFDNKDLWFATFHYDGTGYQEKRLTQTENDNTWPFIVLDLPRQKIYVSYSFFGQAPTYSAQGIPQVKEEIKLARMNFDGSAWENLGKGGLKIFGVDNQSGVLYGIYQKPKKDLGRNEKAERYFAVYDPNKDELKKQFIPSGDEQTYYDAVFQKFDNETKRIFGSQQVCRYAGERGIECQIWTYTARVLKEGEKSTLPIQKNAEMAAPQFRQLPEFKIISVEAVGNKIKINTNRKLSMPVEIKITSNNQEIKWEPRQLSQVDQDKGIELHFDSPLSSYEAHYKVCALSSPQKPECEENDVSYSGKGIEGATGAFEGKDFKITIPEGWLATGQVPGVLLTIVKSDDAYPQEPSVQALNFKSYITIASDKTNGKSISQLAEEAKNELIKSIPSLLIANSSEGTINNMPAKFYEFNVPQQGIDFKVLMAIVAKADKVFVISFNTTANRWQTYKDIFYQTAESFEFRY